MSGCPNKKEMEESMINCQAAIKSELLEIEKKIRLDMLKDIQKGTDCYNLQKKLESLRCDIK